MDGFREPRRACPSATFAPDVTTEIVGAPGDVHDLESYVNSLTAILAAFPACSSQLAGGAAGDVVSRFTARGTHRGDQLGFPATGKSVTFQGIVVDRLRDGKIVDRHEIVEMLGLLQLGLIPSPTG